MIRTGQPAPLFALPDADMQPVELASFRGRKHVVLFFYPRDNTPTCTQEASDFSDHEDEFLRHDCVILGVSRDDCLTHAEFRDRNGLSVRLLADPEGEVCRLYGVLQARDSGNGARECVVRSTFVIDKKGVVRHAAYGVNPRHHAAEIFGVVRTLRH